MLRPTPAQDRPTLSESQQRPTAVIGEHGTHWHQQLDVFETEVSSGHGCGRDDRRVVRHLQGGRTHDARTVSDDSRAYAERTRTHRRDLEGSDRCRRLVQPAHLAEVCRSSFVGRLGPLTLGLAVVVRADCLADSIVVVLPGDAANVRWPARPGDSCRAWALVVLVVLVVGLEVVDRAAKEIAADDVREVKAPDL